MTDDVMRLRDCDPDLIGDDAEPIFLIDVEEISRVVNPLTSPPWQGCSTPITSYEIRQAIADGNLVEEHIGRGSRELLAQAAEHGGDVDSIRRLHIGRIAHFVLNMPEDPISIDVGVPDLGLTHWPAFVVEDGHHRLAASIILGGVVKVTFSGSYSAFEALFPDAMMIVTESPAAFSA